MICIFKKCIMLTFVALESRAACSSVVTSEGSSSVVPLEFSFSVLVSENSLYQYSGIGGPFVPVLWRQRAVCSSVVASEGILVLWHQRAVCSSVVRVLPVISSPTSVLHL
ncbi:hypothetical protein OTU49_007160 [Cherax quadricarinatus]|uniref:Secreted protein n=1 Tax=Cherax quadricarinatus TaxID=27406 RepID=A0AAW0WKC6_CHEQU